MGVNSVVGVLVDDSLGNRIAAIRARMGRLTQTQMARHVTEKATIEVDSDRLSRIESGREVKFYEAIAILRALRSLDPDSRSYDWLIGTDPLPLKKAAKKKQARKSVIVEPIVTKRSRQRRDSA